MLTPSSRVLGGCPAPNCCGSPRSTRGWCVFRTRGHGASDADHDRRTDEAIAAIAAEGEAFFGGTAWRGRRAMQVSACNWQTSERDVKRAVDSVAEVLKVAKVLR